MALGITRKDGSAPAGGVEGRLLHHVSGHYPRLRGEDWAKRIMLTLEYAPEPPFVGGTPARAAPADVDAILTSCGPALDDARWVAEMAASRL